MPTDPVDREAYVGAEAVYAAKLTKDAKAGGAGVGAQVLVAGPTLTMEPS